MDNIYRFNYNNWGSVVRPLSETSVREKYKIQTMNGINRRSISRRSVLKKGVIVSSVIGVGTSTASAHKGKLQQQLAEARSATAAYNDPANAYEDGYTATDASGDLVALEDVQDKGLAVCGMGYHFLNFGIIGGISGGADPDRKRPPILVYGVGDDDDLILGAVEYLAKSPHPGLFHGDDDDDHWEPWPPNTKISALHAWVHTHNPEGVFHPTNPREQFHPDGCIGGH